MARVGLRRATRLADVLTMLVVVLLSSGNPIYLGASSADLVLLLALVTMLLALVMRGVKVETRDLWVIGSFFVLTVFHLLNVPGATVASSVGFLVRLLIGWAAFRIVPDAPRVLLVVLAWLAAIALLIFSVDKIMAALGIDLAVALAPVSRVEGDFEFVFTPVHVFPGGGDRVRNAGIFWEPGALAGYSLLGLLLLAFVAPHISRARAVAATIVLSLAVLSTQSTTGYIVLPLVLFFLFVRTFGSKGSGFVVVMLAGALPLVIAAAVAAYELPFMREKIELQLLSVEMGQGEWELTRVGNLINDIADIRERPLAGWGANPLVRPSQLALSETARMTQGNGFASWLVRFGIFGLAIFLGALAGGLRRYGRVSRAESWLAVGIVCVLLQGEAFLNYPLFLGLMFIGAGPVLQRFWVVPVPVGSFDPARR